MTKKKVYVTLQDGQVFQGYRFGEEGDVTGELVFSTGMVGYMETLTDPSNLGQIVVQTFPLIGNYGGIRADMESKKAWLSGYIVREYCEDPSNFRMEEKLENFMKEEGIVGVYGLDTRALTKLLREKGVMNARISNKPLTTEEVNALASHKTKEAVAMVSGAEKGYFASENGEYTVIFWDFGGKNSTLANWNHAGCNLIRMPADATAEEVLELGADGILLSDGPGDPMENTALIAEVKKVLGKLPVLGVGLGHQLVALALGGKTQKMKCGHRGSNQPVKCLESGKVYISSQNHGYEVINGSVPQGKLSFVNVNDGSCEGMEYAEYKAITVQFDPASCGIGHPENVLYNQFFAMMKEGK